MARRGTKKHTDPNVREAKCSVCHTTAQAVPGKKHRNCAGKVAKPVSPHKRVPREQRGTWG